MAGYKNVGILASGLTSVLMNSSISVAMEADQAAFQQYAAGVLTYMLSLLCRVVACLFLFVLRHLARARAALWLLPSFCHSRQSTRPEAFQGTRFMLQPIVPSPWSPLVSLSKYALSSIAGKRRALLLRQYLVV